MFDSINKSITNKDLNLLLKEIYNLSHKKNKEGILYWIFLDSERIEDYKIFLDSIPASNKIAVVMRQKNRKNLYYKSKSLLRICKKKRFKFLISSNLAIARAIGADGVHYSKQINYAKKYRDMIVSCSCHGKNDFRRVKRLKADIVFISPLYSTESDKKKTPLGLKKISLLANYIKCQYSLLGGVNYNNIKSLRNRGISSVSGLGYIYSLLK